MPYISSVIDQRGCQNVEKTSMTHLGNALCASVIYDQYYYWTDARQHGIYYLNWDASHKSRVWQPLSHMTKEVMLCPTHIHTKWSTWATRIYDLINKRKSPLEPIKNHQLLAEVNVQQSVWISCCINWFIFPFLIMIRLFSPLWIKGNWTSIGSVQNRFTVFPLIKCTKICGTDG